MLRHALFLPQSKFNNRKKIPFNLNYGFTLIELLVVIAVIGVLASIVTVVINPQEQIARSKDAKRKAGVNTLALALNEYGISNSGSYPPSYDNDTGYHWMDSFIERNTLKARVPQVSYNPAVSNLCKGTYNVEDFCYFNLNGNAFIMVQLESKLEKNKCASGETPYFMYSTGDAKAGVICYSDPGWTLTPGSYDFKD